MPSRPDARHDPLVALTRADLLSPFYDPQYARPLSSTPPAGWGEIDAGSAGRSACRRSGLPLDLLPTFWRDWVADTANATRRARRLCRAVAARGGERALAARAPSCGWGARWTEPLVLWQALVGLPSSGKSPAMAPMRELLAALDAEQATTEAGKPRA